MYVAMAGLLLHVLRGAWLPVASQQKMSSSEAVCLPSLTPSKVPVLVGAEARGGDQRKAGVRPGYDTPLTKISRLAQSWKQPARKPGDVFRPGPGEGSHRPRPLGLLPERDRYVDPYALYLELMRPVQPLPVPAAAEVVAPMLMQTGGEREDRSPGSSPDLSSHRSVRMYTRQGRKAARAHHGQPREPQQREAVSLVEKLHGVPYRLHTAGSGAMATSRSSNDLQPLAGNRGAATVGAGYPVSTEMVDQRIQELEYYQSMRTMAEMSVDVADSDSRQPPQPQYRPLPPVLPRPHYYRTGRLNTAGAASTAGSKTLSHATAYTLEALENVQRGHTRACSAPSYFSFVNQASTGSRLVSRDSRCADDYQGCERCRIKGGRCHSCVAIRTGGGYIILDGEDDDGKGRGSGRGNGKDGNHGNNHSRRGRASEGNGGSSLNMIQEGDEIRNGSGNGDGDGQLGNGHSGGGLTAADMRGRGDGGQRGDSGRSGGAGGRGGLLGNGSDSNRIQSGRNRTGVGGNHGDRTGSGLNGDGSGGVGDDSSGRGLSTGRDGGEGEGQGGGVHGNQEDEDGRGGKGGDLTGGTGKKGSKELDSSLNKHKGKGGRGQTKEGGGSDQAGSGGKEQQGRPRRGERESGDGDGDGESVAKTTNTIRSLRGDGPEEEDVARRPYTADLRRVRKRKDDVKALSCTMRDLKDIDPLDYLAKYCILDPKKTPAYRRVFDNVDRDEDDEINISELDFALKSVNYDLISDSELTFVHSILELAGRWKLNFRLFSLIAALSEKVVSLEDMVKKLINGMDFQSLEVKMKKCKELFYLLDSMDSTGRGGVVTTDSLGVELQAGGLTQEHIDFVVDRLNHEGRGIVEFLDYLTYVPLFVEIHDHICGNPLDVTRVK